MHLEQLMPLIEEYLAQGKPVKFSPRGISMLPMLRQGVDSVILESHKGVLRKYDIPLYRRDDGCFVLHRVVKVGKTYTCIGDNQFVLEKGIRQDQIIAIVTGFYRGTKYYSVNNMGYLLYSRVWHCSRGIRHFCGRCLAGIRRRLR